MLYVLLINWNRIGNRHLRKYRNLNGKEIDPCFQSSREEVALKVTVSTIKKKNGCKLQNTFKFIGREMALTG